ncbi:hypothetical protein CW705_07815 [Candidatus Bathyarchaeota archaeon]|nr:MAG: hypothetical protein CW705_07815 [Candidatus Bathyarchaeota archaeon]
MRGSLQELVSKTIFVFFVYGLSLLPHKAKTGRPRADDRMVLNGILYVTAWRRLKR